MERQRINTVDLCLVGIGAAAIVVLSQLSIPMPSGVPITLQTFIIALAGIILGPKRGAMAALLYVLLGAIGLPFYAGFTGGLGILFGVSGGYLLAFPLMAWLAGWGANRESHLWTGLGLLTGVVVDYAAGLLMFMLVTGSDLRVGLALCVVPFLPGEAIKMVLAGLAGTKCREALGREGVLPV